MNLPRFLMEVDSALSIMSKEELTDFIHDMARKLPEAKRADFLGRLKEMQGKQEESQAADYEEKDEMLRKFEKVKEKLKSIEDGELCLVGSLNDEYSEWYNSDVDEFLYEDPEGVLDVLGDACGFLRQCVDCQEYEIGYEMAQILMDLHIMVSGEYLDYTDEPLGMKELEYYNLCDLDYKQVVVDALHAAYCANALPDRADAIYGMMEDSERNDITMEMVMQNGEELPEIDEFLKLWIEYLSPLTTRDAERLIKEALELANNPELLLETARKCCAQHPALYERYIFKNMHRDDDIDLLEICKEALAAIDDKYIVRSRIALLMSTVALKQGRQLEAEKAWLEAFRSDTRIVNYVRLFMNCKDFSTVKDEAKNIYHRMYSQVQGSSYVYGSSKELKENWVGSTTVHMLAFLEGEFQYVKEQAMATSDALGWSSSFMKHGLAAFLLLLLEDENLQQGCKTMCCELVHDMDFDVAEYQQGTLEILDDSSESWFWKCLCHWKGIVSISKEEKKLYLQWLEGLVAKRVKGIMEGNHRAYYGECAGYIAALGEVKESMGERNGKQKILLEYKALYSRRTAFHRELRGFGMKD